MTARVANIGGIPRYAGWAGPALFSQGFRPFFLAAGVAAVAYVALWIAMLTGNLEMPTAFPFVLWHAHEMIFGVIGAVVAGFILTAIPNWTGRMPLQGWGLIALFSLWLAGRGAVAFSAVVGGMPAAVIDLSFLTGLMAVALREVAAGRNWRNLPVVFAIGLLAVANGLTHAEAMGLLGGGIGPRLGVAVIVMLIALIGGRIIPSFTGNWLAKTKPAVPRPVPFDAFDRVALVVTLAAFTAWVASPYGALAAYGLTAAGALHLVRMARWRGLHTASDPLVWTLHLSYLWVPVGLILLGASGLLNGLPQSAGLHALTTGAMGGMVLAVMTRATLGHTGRDLKADLPTALVYLLVYLAAVARVSAGLGMDHGMMLTLSAVLWCAAFAMFCLRYGPILLRPR